MTGEHDAGKGDCPRKVDGEKFRENYDRIFRGNRKPSDNCCLCVDPSHCWAHQECVKDSKKTDQ